MPGPQYEFQIVLLSGNDDDSEAEETLNLYGAMGWQLVSVIRLSGAPIGVPIERAFFQRRVIEQPPAMDPDADLPFE